MEAKQTSDQTYNGWSNYETWAVNMFLDGNYDGEGVYLEAQEITRQAMETSEDAYGLAADLKNYVEEAVISDQFEGLRGDLLGAALSEVDWQELAEAQIEAANES